MKVLTVAICVGTFVFVSRWRRGRCQWWVGGERLAIGAALPRDRALVLRAEDLLRCAV
jgi:hypothetical protein